MKNQIDNNGENNEMENGEIKLSIVVPCYNEELVIDELYNRVTDVCRRCVDDDYEFLLINDGSYDNTWRRIEDLAEADSHIVGINLSRNFGHQYALSAGLDICRGERILVIDADLQDPPELLPKMMERIDMGVDVVFGQRDERKGEKWFKKISAVIFYRVLFKMSDVSIPVDTGDFRMMTKKVNDTLKEMPERNRFIRGMVAWLGFKQEPIVYTRQERFAGNTKYPLKKMIKFALDAITGFSVSPLKIATYFSILFSTLALAIITYVLYSWIYKDAVPGWASIAIIVSLLGSVQLATIGIMGEYIGRIYMESKKRPLYVVNQIVSSRVRR